MLFGDDNTLTASVPWWWLAIAGTGGPAVGWLVKELWSWIRDKRAYDKEVKREALDEAYKFIDRLQDDLTRTEARNDELTAKASRCDVKYERAVTKIEYYEELLTNAKIPFRPWRDPDHGTDEHRMLPPGGN